MFVYLFRWKIAMFTSALICVSKCLTPEHTNAVCQLKLCIESDLKYSVYNNRSTHITHTARACQVH